MHTFILPALWPNFSVSTPKESITPTGTGGFRPAAVNASFIRTQSNRWMLWPAHILPFKTSNILSATSSNVGASATASRVIPSLRPDLKATMEMSLGFMSVVKLSSSVSFQGQKTTAPNSSTVKPCPALLGTVVSRSKKTISISRLLHEWTESDASIPEFSSPSFILSYILYRYPFGENPQSWDSATR